MWSKIPKEFGGGYGFYCVKWYYGDGTPENYRRFDSIDAAVEFAIALNVQSYHIVIRRVQS